MKTIFSLVIFFGFIISSFSQVPQGFNYQAIIRNSAGQEIINQAVGVQIGLLQYASDGSAVYVERFTPLTNAFGLVNLVIGTGDVQSGDFTLIDWGNGPYYLKVEVDEGGGTSYTDIGTIQLLSVPYSIYAESSRTTDYNNIDNVPDLSVYATKDMDNKNLTNLADPIDAQDAATKKYLDDKISGLNAGDLVMYDGNKFISASFSFYYQDADSDEYGNESAFVYSLVKPDGFTLIGGDCDDNNASIHPGAEEISDDGIDQDCDGIDGNPTVYNTIRIAISNTTSGAYQSYDPGHGIRLMQGIDADVLLVQKCMYGANTTSELQAFTNLVLGSGYYSIGSGSIPNMIMSRYPIIDEGSITDPAVSNRDIRWAVLDVPGDRDFIVYSVNFLNDLSSRNSAFDLIKDQVSAQLAASEPESYHCVIGGTFGGNLSEISSMVANSAFEWQTPLPTDKNGNTGTDASRTECYDYLISDADLNDLEIVTSYGDGESYPNGMVFDSRLYEQSVLDSWFSPVLVTDSDAVNMQHMIVVRTVSIPVQ